MSLYVVVHDDETGEQFMQSLDDGLTTESVQAVKMGVEKVDVQP